MGDGHAVRQAPSFLALARLELGENFSARRSIIAALVLFAVGALITTLFKGQETQIDKIIASSRATAYLTAFLAIATAPIVEEVIYRGLLYSALQRCLA
jgi:membrane protease YdiL (CAAX protease family)